MGLIRNDWRDTNLFCRAKQSVRDVHTVLDVGPGMRPQTLVTCDENICMEPHYEYAQALEDAGFKVLRGAAPQAFEFVYDEIDTVVMLDVIEHMSKEDGAETVKRACAIAREQVIVFTPLGFKEQSGGEATDAWGMHGQHWQRHRSGWTPEDFHGWLHLVDKNFSAGHAAFFAIWNRP